MYYADNMYGKKWPPTHPINVIVIRAKEQPINTKNLEYFIESNAAIIKVLSPISDIMLDRNDPKNGPISSIDF